VCSPGPPILNTRFQGIRVSDHGIRKGAVPGPQSDRFQGRPVLRGLQPDLPLLLCDGISPKRTESSRQRLPGPSCVGVHRSVRKCDDQGNDRRQEKEPAGPIDRGILRDDFPAAASILRAQEVINTAFRGVDEVPDPNPD
jgi:hypothetical protein